MTIKSRQDKIIELITEGDISTQQMLVAALRAAGFDATQATVSRDIRQLRLTKVPDANGNSYYRLPLAGAETADRYLEAFQHVCLSVEAAGQMVVIRTTSGMAMALAAVIDGLHLKQIAGCIAGDDTIFAAARKESDAHTVAAHLKTLLQG